MLHSRRERVTRTGELFEDTSPLRCGDSLLLAALYRRRRGDHRLRCTGQLPCHRDIRRDGRPGCDSDDTDRHDHPGHRSTRDAGTDGRPHGVRVHSDALGRYPYAAPGHLMLPHLHDRPGVREQLHFAEPHVSSTTRVRVQRMIDLTPRLVWSRR